MDSNSSSSGSGGWNGPSRGHRPPRGGGGGGRGGRGGRGGGRGRGGGWNGQHRDGRQAATPNNTTTDTQLAPGQPHPGFFHESFVGNPWYDLEEKLGIPHVPAVSPNQTPSSQPDDVIESSTTIDAQDEARAQSVKDQVSSTVDAQPAPE
ncbi:hypothetical protein PANT_7d00062 [Moesziomyces antarcticus T-34]|uniref:Uncharacterized protein n=1 Tax=Pseudozyma antarctica (strain T-34) TaxID=1151754 RepID=M9MD67_PSEA3|nr:hypothetical protein PANT_7d00062 [Moesziomyces antarcticus T-34]